LLHTSNNETVKLETVKDIQPVDKESAILKVLILLIYSW